MAARLICFVDLFTRITSLERKNSLVSTLSVHLLFCTNFKGRKRKMISHFVPQTGLNLNSLSILARTPKVYAPCTSGHALLANQVATSHLTNQDARVFVTHRQTNAISDTTRDIIHKAVFFQCTFPSSRSGMGHHGFLTLGNKPGHRSITCSLEVAHDCVLGCSHLNFSPMCRLSTCVRES